MLSSLGVGAEVNGCAMQCGYDGFEASNFLGNRSEPYLTAECRLNSSLTGIGKQATMIAQSLLQTFDGYSSDEINAIPIVFCLPNRPDIWDAQQNAVMILSRVKELLAEHNIRPNKHNQLILENRCAVASAFGIADDLLKNRVAQQVAVVTSDSLITRSAMDYFSGDMYEDGIRLLTEDNPNGFIPGEATVSFIISNKTEKGQPHLVCSGWGQSEEQAIWVSGKVCNAKGLVQSTRNALQMAEQKMSDMDFILSSVSGEDYFFKEVALASTQSLEQKVDEQPLYLPATHIGEVGTAIGGAMLVMLLYAMKNDFGQNYKAVVMISDDDSQRTSFIIECVGQD